jgi:hypothetical protein
MPETVVIATCGCNRYGCIYCELDQARDSLKHGDILERLAQKVTAAWDRLARCQDEFYPEYPEACGEYIQELDEAVLLLMRFADPERWNQRQQMMRDSFERRAAHQRADDDDGGGEDK